jgi:hypothetical protein
MPTRLPSVAPMIVPTLEPDESSLAALLVLILELVLVAVGVDEDDDDVVVVGIEARISWKDLSP